MSDTGFDNVLQLCQVEVGEGTKELCMIFATTHGSKIFSELCS